MKAPGGGCDIAGLTQDMRDIGSQYSKDKEIVKRFGSGATNVVKTVFEEVFDVPIESYKAVKFTKGTLKTFERRLMEIKRASENGSISNKFGSLFYTPSAIAKKNPHLMNLMDKLHNTNLSFQGRTGRHNRAYRRILDHFKKEILVNTYEKQGWIQEKSAAWNLKRAQKQATEHETIIEKLAVDAYNNVAGSKTRLSAALKAEDAFYTKGEGKVFNDMIVTIEKTLPKIEREAYKAWESKASGKDGYRAQLKKGKISRERFLTLRRKALEPILATKIKSQPMRRAVEEYLDLSNEMYDVMEKGIKAYGNTVKEGLKGKYTNDQIDDIVKKIVDKVSPDRQKGYYPHYRRVLSIDFMDNLMPRMQRVTDALAEGLTKDSGNVDKAVEELNAYVTSKAKSRQIVDLDKGVDSKNEYSRNFFVNVKRYVDEIDRFNMVAHADLYTRQSLNAAKEMFKNGEPIDGFARATVDMMKDMNARMKGGYGFENENMDAAMKTLLAIEFTSKLGFNLRSPFKNATQGLLNLVEFGPITIGKASTFYKDNQDLKNIVNTLMDESGFLFADDAAPELIESKTRGKSYAQKIKINDNEELEFKKPAFFSTMHDKVGKLAGVSGTLMSKVENFNRKTTFKVAFYKMYQDLDTSTAYNDALIKKGLSTEQIAAEKIKRARNYALRKTTLLHFDYTDIAKSSWLTHPTGRLLGQFQHYGIKFLEYNMNLVKEGKDDIQTGMLLGDRAKKAYSMGFIYLLAPVIASAATGLDFTNIVQHDSKEKIDKLWTLFTGDDDEVKNAFYGKGVLTGLPFIGAPVISDAIALGNIHGFLDMDDESKEKLLIGWEDYAMKSGDQKAYETLRILNTSLSRMAYKTMPKVLEGDMFNALGYELGFYRTDKSKKLKKDTFKHSVGSDAYLPDDVLSALDAIGSHTEDATQTDPNFSRPSVRTNSRNYLVNK